MVTKATLGRFSGNPNVLDHFYRGGHFEATYDLGTKGRPLKHPILDDHVRGNQVRCTLGVACASVSIFSYIIFVFLGVLPFIFRSCHTILVSIHLSS